MSNVIWTKRNSWPLCDGPDVAGAFRPIKVVGEGAFGVVLLVRKVLGPGRGSTHAMKIMHKEAVDRRVLVAEREILGKVCGIDSRFLVRLQYAFQSRDKVFLVMEYSGGGGLVDHVARCGGKLRKDASRRLAAQLASGLRDLHAHSIIHRDLKPENVLLHDDGFVKIADFGLSTLCPTTVQRGGPAARKAGFAGTVEYAAPERLQKTGGVTTAAVDWWAFGAILFECVCGRTPFGAATARDLFINVLFRDPAFENAFDDDPFARDLLEGLLLKDPQARLAPWNDRAFAQFVEHAFFNGDFAKSLAAPVGPAAPPPPPEDDGGADESVEDVAAAYFKDADESPAKKSVAIAGFEFAACAAAEDDEEPLIVGTIDGEEVRELPPKHRRPSDTSATNKAFLFCCSALDGKKKKNLYKPVTYDPPRRATSSDSTFSMPDFDGAFNVSVVDLAGDGSPRKEASDDDESRGSLGDALKDMLFFVCYEDPAAAPAAARDAAASDDAAS